MNLKQYLGQLKLKIQRQSVIVEQPHTEQTRSNEERYSLERKLWQLEPLLRQMRDTYTTYKWFPDSRTRIYFEYNDVKPSRSRIVMEWDLHTEWETVRFYPDRMIRIIEYYQKISVELESAGLAVLCIGNEKFQFDPSDRETENVLISKIKNVIALGRANRSRVIEEYPDEPGISA